MKALLSSSEVRIPEHAASWLPYKGDYFGSLKSFFKDPFAAAITAIR